MAGHARRIPGRPYRGPTAPQEAFQHLAEYHGMRVEVASNRLHLLKQQHGLGPADDVAIGRTGDVHDARTGQWLGTLTDRRLGRTR